jgi:DMSO/TMAO reductase YedYZ molybdopterin-dependent catalytic subunit
MSKLKDFVVGCGLAVITSVVWVVAACSPAANTQVVAKPPIGTTMTNPTSTTLVPVSPGSTAVASPTTTVPPVTGSTTATESPTTTTTTPDLPQVDISPPTTADSSAVFNIDINSYNLVVNGLVNNKLSLNYAQILAYPSVTQKAEIICPDTEDEWDSWTGVPVATLLNAAGLLPDSTEIVFTGNDGYYVQLPLKTVLSGGVFLAYQMNGQQLTPDRGYPLRLVVTGDVGADWLRWVTNIQVKGILTLSSDSSAAFRQASSNIPTSGNKLCACFLSAAVINYQSPAVLEKLEPDNNSESV